MVGVLEGEGREVGVLTTRVAVPVVAGAAAVNVAAAAVRRAATNDSVDDVGVRVGVVVRVEVVLDPKMPAPTHNTVKPIHINRNTKTITRAMLLARRGAARAACAARSAASRSLRHCPDRV